MPGHKNKKKEAGKMGPGGESPKGGKPETGKDIMDKAEKATPLDPNSQKPMPKGKKSSKGKADGPSHFALSGQTCDSKNKPAILFAIPDLANSNICPLLPPEDSEL